MTRTAKQPAKKRKTVKMKTWRGYVYVWPNGDYCDTVFANKPERHWDVDAGARIARVEVSEIVTKRSKK